MSISEAIFWKSALLLTFPLIFAGVLHMVVVKLDALSYLKIPLHETWFGLNKTWRGILVMLAASIVGVRVAQQGGVYWETDLLQFHSSWWLGLALGLGYVLPELPNSYMKRRLGVKPGELSQRSPWLFALIDQADSVIGCVLVYALCGVGNPVLWFTLIGLGTGIHLLLNFLLWAVGVRKNPL